MEDITRDLNLIWKVGVLVSMAVILLLPPLPSALCYTSSGGEREPQQKKELTVELIHGSQELRSREVSGIQWTLDGERFTYYQPESGTKRPCVWSYDLKTVKREIFIDSKRIRVLEEPKIEKRITLGNYFWSPTGSGSDGRAYEVLVKSLDFGGRNGRFVRTQ